MDNGITQRVDGGSNFLLSIELTPICEIGQLTGAGEVLCSGGQPSAKCLFFSIFHKVRKINDSVNWFSGNGFHRFNIGKDRLSAAMVRQPRQPVAVDGSSLNWVFAELLEMKSEIVGKSSVSLPLPYSQTLIVSSETITYFRVIGRITAYR